MSSMNDIYTYLQRAVSDLEYASQAINKVTRSMSDSNHLVLIEHFDHVRKLYDRLSDVKKSLNDTHDMLSREMVPDAMKAAKVKTVNIEGIGRVTVSYRWSCSMPDKVSGIQWLKENGHGDIVQETVNAQTLAAFARNLLEEKGEDLPVDLFKTGTSPFTSITKK